MYPITMVLLVLLYLPSSWAATELAPDVLYQPGTQLKISSMGLQLTVPTGWQGMLPQGSEAMIFEPLDGVARMIVSAVSPANAQTMLTVMTASQPLDVNTIISPNGPMRQAQGLYHQGLQLQGENPQNLDANAIGRLGDNETAVFIVMLEQAGQSLLPATGEHLLQTMTFSKPLETPAASSDSNAPIDWNERLRGRTLRYLKTESGYSVDKRLNLCSDGRFAYSDQDSYVSSDAISDFSAAGQSGQSGRWKIDGNRLSLAWDDGSSADFRLSRRYVEQWSEWGTFVDDERWFNVANKVCQ